MPCLVDKHAAWGELVCQAERRPDKLDAVSEPLGHHGARLQSNACKHSNLKNRVPCFLDVQSCIASMHLRSGLCSCCASPIERGTRRRTRQQQPSPASSSLSREAQRARLLCREPPGLPCRARRAPGAAAEAGLLLGGRPWRSSGLRPDADGNRKGGGVTTRDIRSRKPRA